MKFSARVVSSLAMTATLSLLASPAHAVSDHLHCYKIKDSSAKAEYTADLSHTDLTFPNATGCEIKTPAKLLCVDTTKSNVDPAPPGAADGAATQKYLCYKAKCPKAQPATTLTDQFGSHPVQVKSTSMLCAPIPNPATCSDAIQNGAETDVDCGGGTCSACANGDSCLLATDCTSGNCSGNVCAPAAPTCSDNTQNGSETGVDCGGGTCSPCGSGQGCGTGSDCLSGSCVSGVCASLLPNGSNCTLNSECTNSNCVDGKCCNSACNGACQACSAVKKGGGMDGACGPIAMNTDPDGECIDQGASSCGTSGLCSGSSSCSVYPAGTVCNLGFCSGITVTPNDTCDGAGSCIDAGSQPCTPYACGATTCNTNCGFDSDCNTVVAYCSSGNCVYKLANGEACSANSQCLSGNCPAGTCVP